MRLAFTPAEFLYIAVVSSYFFLGEKSRAC